MGRMTLLRCGAMALVLATGGCGGGSGSPAPAPAPTPTPTPTPAPTPTASVTGRFFAATNGPCFVYLYSTAERSYSDSQVSGRYCSVDGLFGTSVVPLRGVAFGPRLFGDLSQSYLDVGGVEQAGLTYFRFSGPLGTRVFSPLSTLIEQAGSQTAVKRALGLDSGLFSLSTDRDLLTFDPAVALASNDESLRREGARIAAANLRAAAVAAGLFIVVKGQGQFDPYGPRLADYQLFGQFLATNNSGFIFDNAVMTRLLGATLNPNFYRADVLSAAAHLIDAYASTIGVQVSDQQSAARFTLGITGYLQVELSNLLRANSAEAATAALAVTNQTILDRTAIYLQAPYMFRQVIPANNDDAFYPGPDFFTTSGNSLTIQAGGLSPSILANDLYADVGGTPGTNPGLFPSSSSQVVRVIVNPEHATEIAASISNGVITVAPLSGFKGQSFFLYRVRHPSGIEAGGVVYVTFK